MLSMMVDTCSTWWIHAQHGGYMLNMVKLASDTRHRDRQARDDVHPKQRVSPEGQAGGHPEQQSIAG